MHPPPSGILSQIRMVRGNEDILKSFATSCQRSMLVCAFRFGFAMPSILTRLERPQPNTLFPQRPSLPSGTSEARRQVAFLTGLGTCIRHFQSFLNDDHKIQRYLILTHFHSPCHTLLGLSPKQSNYWDTTMASCECSESSCSVHSEV